MHKMKNYHQFSQKKKTDKRKIEKHSFPQKTCLEFNKWNITLFLHISNVTSHSDVISSNFRAWVLDSSEIVESATNRVGLLTGLTTKYLEKYSNTEAFQIVNYGIAGMYHPHFDAFVVSNPTLFVALSTVAPASSYTHDLKSWTGFKHL
jgi:hypothetical protein